MERSWILRCHPAIRVLATLSLIILIGCSGREAEFDELEKAAPGSLEVELDTSDGATAHQTDFTVEETQAKADILFVIDNSGSMEYEHRSMARRFRNMIDQIGAVDWQIAITNTDNSGLIQNNGRLFRFNNGERILTSDLDPDDAEDLFADAIEIDYAGEDIEQGLTAVVEAIDRIDNSSANRAFFRDDSHLSVVVISDEDESYAPFEGITTPDEVLKKVDDQWNGTKSFMFHSIITRPNDFFCLNQNGASFGSLYAELSALTGGVIGSVCENDYAKQLADIGHKVVINSMPRVQLDCEPIDQDGDGQPDIWLNDELLAPDQVNVDGSNLSFSEELELGDYQLKYACAGETSD